MGFVGREADLQVLDKAYAEASKGQVRLVALLAESGFGKTRLAWEFYSRLSSRNYGPESMGYWPDQLLKHENNLRVNPDPESCGLTGQDMPFLWWGLRIANPGARNQSVDGALHQSVKTLKPHLGRYEKASRLKKLRKFSRESVTDLTVDAADFATEFWNLATFGLLGVGKTIYSVGKKEYDRRREIREITALDVTPGATAEKQRDLLTDTIVNDLSILAKNAPEGMSPIPLVIILDDIHWVDADPGVGAFMEALLTRARAESWPLLIILTSWRKEWVESAAARKAPASWIATGDIVHELGRVDGLDAILRHSFSGIPVTQQQALLDKVDGNPRLLDEVMCYLKRNPKHFTNLDLQAPLKAADVSKILQMNFAEFATDRLNRSPLHVQKALALASIQGEGVVFSPAVARKSAKKLGVGQIERGLSESDSPHSFTTLSEGGEFRLRAYSEVSRDNIGNFLDEDTARAVVRKVLLDTAERPAEADGRELRMSFDAILSDDTESPCVRQASAALGVAGELVRRARAEYDSRSAGEIAQRVYPLLASGMTPSAFRDILDIIEADFLWSGAHPRHVDTLGQLVELLQAKAADTQYGRELAVALHYLGETVNLLEGPGAALPWREQALARFQERAEATPTTAARRELCNALLCLADSRESLDGPQSGLRARSDAVEILRDVVASQVVPVEQPELALSLGGIIDVISGLEQPEDAQEDLAEALVRLAETTQHLEGPAVACRLLDEAVTILRDVVTRRPTLAAKLQLSRNLAKLGTMIAESEGPKVAVPTIEGAISLLREMVDADMSGQARASLVSTLCELGTIIEQAESVEAACRVYEEAVMIARGLVATVPTIGSKLLLTVSLSDLGSVTNLLKGPEGALTLYREEVALYRDLVRNSPSLALRQTLAKRLSALSKVIEKLESSEAAQPFHTEEVAVRRNILSASPTPEARQELATALGRLCERVAELEGESAAQPLRAEKRTLERRLLEDKVAALRGDVEAGPKPQTSKELAYALVHLGRLVEEDEGPAAARHLLEESVAILRPQYQVAATLWIRLALTLALQRLADLVERLEGPDAAQPLRGEKNAIEQVELQRMVTLARASVKAQPAPHKWSLLSQALKNLGRKIEKTEGPEAAQPLHAEAFSIECEQAEAALARARAELEANPAPGTKAQLARALGLLVDLVKRSDDPEAARPLHEEGVSLVRALEEEKQVALHKVSYARANVAANPTPEAQRDLARALRVFGEFIVAMENQESARPLLDEAVTLLRASIAANPAPDTQCELDRLTSWLEFF